MSEKGRWTIRCVFPGFHPQRSRKKKAEELYFTVMPHGGRRGKKNRVRTGEREQANKHVNADI